MLAIGFFIGWAVLLFGTAFAAALSRSLPARVCAFAAVLAWLLTLLVMNRRGDWDGQMAVAVVDAAMFLTLLGVGLRASFLWPLLAAGFQGAGLALHVADLIMTEPLPGALLVALQGTSFAAQLTILGGVLASFRQRQGRDIAPEPAQALGQA
jgi:hypothetical protein